MSTLDSDHNHYALDYSQQACHSADYPPSKHSLGTADDRVDTAKLASQAYAIQQHLPAHAYTPSAPKRPLVSTTFEQYASNASVHGFTGEAPREDNSPDPHEFYRRHQDSFARGPIEGLGQGDIVVARREDTMTTSRHQQKSNPTVARINGSRVPPLSSRLHSPQASRYPSSPSSDKPSLGGTRSNPALSNTARNRQTSLKDLVNRFNQTPDEVPPLPREPTSRSTSANSNPAPSLSYVRARNSTTQSKSSGGASTTRESPTDQQPSAKVLRFHRRRGRTNEVADSSPKSKSPQRPTSKAYASQSMIDLSPDGGPPRQTPLFGEVLALGTGNLDAGYGIVAPRRRRGSEGSMRSPNPMFPEEQDPKAQEISPSSPSAWYMGVTSTLEEIKMEKTMPNLHSTSIHRRTRSDFSGAPITQPFRGTTGMHTSKLSRPKDLLLPSAAIGTVKRDSQSRIPLSTRRMSINSDSGNSTPSTRTNSAMSRHSGHVTSPPKGSGALPKFAQKARSPVRNAGSSPSRNPPRRMDYSSGAQRPATSPRLAAYISAPLPKNSPSLRSSRPRQPVSSASTSASRARAVDRYSGHEIGSPKSTRESRKSKPPELGDVDFAARRQKIQQAFTKTVKENERQEGIAVEREWVFALQGEQSQQRDQTVKSAEAPAALEDEVMEDSEHPNLEDLGEFDEEGFGTPVKEYLKTERELTINTGHLSERSVLDLSQEDSPTLGGFYQYSHLNHTETGDVTPPSDAEPTSAITVGTSDSVDTFFDNETQEDSDNAYLEHQSLLSHIMSMRDASPSSPTSVRRSAPGEDSISEKDDQESIQIMLGDTPVLERAPYNVVQEDDTKDALSSEGPGSRWSMSSWTSSARSKDRHSGDQERDAPMERIDEHSPSQPTESAHLSISTAGSDVTPQLWSPATFSSARTARSTLDSDGYSTINRVLDHYHDPSVVNPEFMHDFQQHVFTQSPDLARQGGWDPKKVTQLYLQELARGRLTQSGASPDPLKFQIRKATESPSITPAPNDQLDQLVSEKMVRSLETAIDGTQDLSRGDNPPLSVSLDFEDGEPKPQRASLNHPDDWNMSPSIGDWIHLSAADSPLDEKPKLLPNTWNRETESSQASQKTVLSRPRLPEIPGTGEGLGLAINITSPQDDDSPTIPAPPLPSHLPPPPPVEAVDQRCPSPIVGIRSPPSPSIYSKHVPSVVNPYHFPPSLPMNDSNESIRQPGTRTSSEQPSNTSSISQQTPSSIDAPSSTSQAAPKLPSPSPNQKRLTRRRHIIKELVDTEHSFGQDMKVVDDIYKGTSNVIIISAEDVKTLFSNSDQIVGFSTSFLDALKQASKGVYVLPKSKRWRSNRISTATSFSGNTDETSVSGAELTDEEKDRKTFIGEAFAHHMSNMEKVYADYLKNHDAANQKLQVLQKNEKVQIWLKECRAYAHDLTSAWDLDSLLVKPVQRILKYPLLLDQLLEATPENHPDFSHLDNAAREMKGISMRINEMKRRADLMEQVASSRKRKESDVRIGLSKAFGRRTEKLRQQVGLSDMVEDRDYNVVSEKFGSHFFQLQVVMRDVEMYTNDVQQFMNRFSDFILAIEAHIDVGQTSYPEVESKWRKFRMSTREISMTALTDHVNAVRKNVIEPMTTLLKLHDGPQKLMQKRNKRVTDFARFKAIKDRGDKPDKKTVDQGEQFIAINDTLKEDLPKLFSLTGKLVEACLNNFIRLQLQWNDVWRRKLSQAIDDCKVPSNVAEIVEAFTGDYAFFEAQVLSLGICNGSMLADTVNLVNFLSPTATLNGDDFSSQRHASSLDVSKSRTLSVSSEASPVLPQPDFGANHSGSFFGVENGVQLTPGMRSNTISIEASRRIRANSAVSGRSPRTPEMPGSYRSYTNSMTAGNPGPVRPSSATLRSIVEPSQSLPRPSVDASSFPRTSEDSSLVARPPSSSTYPQVVPPQGRASSPSARYSGLFSSAMPMSDSPRTQSPIEGQDRKQFNVLFLAASVYEFNIDRARREAGYPYLTYVAGEIFDVIGEKGELWLAKNQDDSTCQVGWIWNKHFVKLAS